MLFRAFFDSEYKILRNKANLSYIRLFTSFARTMPGFIIIGAQKGGTTALYMYLLQHPCVGPAFIKEPDFFDCFFDRGNLWYRALFPTYVEKLLAGAKHGKWMLAGEASTNYIWHPHVPRRIHKARKDVKLIALLRNPVDRAYSHFQMQVRKKDLSQRETISSFEGAIVQEEIRVPGELERMVLDEDYYSFPYRWYAYLSKGIYIDQIIRWLRVFPEEQLLILRSEDFFADPDTVLKQVLRFLELPEHRFTGLKKHNVGVYAAMNQDTRKRLLGTFRPHNDRLSQLLGMKFEWDE